ncbi:MAG: DUF6261 family protein [Carboxylicivirga sp.]|jgi:hypothetical protein|nr:DUF6261 family protein [Carboxylicivirga sp.]
MKLSFSQFRNKDYVFLLVQFINILRAFLSEQLDALGLSVYLKQAQDRLPDVNLALDKNTKNPYTDLVDERDELRDRAIDSLKYYLLHCINQPDANVVNAAQRIIDVLKTFGWSMQDESNAEQTKRERSFIAEIESNSTLMEDIAAVQATALFDRVKTTQVDFEEARRLSLEAKTSGKAINPMAEKEWVKSLFAKVIVNLNFHHMNETSPEVSNIYNQLSTVIEKIESERKARNTRAKSEAQESGSNGSPE